MRALIALEAFLLTAAALAAEPRPAGGEVPPVELLEFIGEWSAEEQKLIDQAARPSKKTAKPRSRKSDAVEDAEPIRSGPPR